MGKKAYKKHSALFYLYCLSLLFEVAKQFLDLITRYILECLNSWFDANKQF